MVLTLRINIETFSVIKRSRLIIQRVSTIFFSPSVSRHGDHRKLHLVRGLDEHGCFSGRGRVELATLKTREPLALKNTGANSPNQSGKRYLVTLCHFSTFYRLFRVSTNVWHRGEHAEPTPSALRRQQFKPTLLI